jgi:hypothetical protein
MLSSRLLSKNINIKIYKTIIFPVVLYGCETWSLALGEEHKLRMFENRVVRRIFGTKITEVTGDRRKLSGTGLRGGGKRSAAMTLQYRTFASSSK